MTTAEKLQVAAVGIAALAFVGREYNTVRIERKRTQPIVIAHERQSPGLASREGAWVATLSLTNEGGGNAFNARYGIEIRGVRFPYRYDMDDPPSGNRLRVIRVGQEVGAIPMVIQSLEMWNLASLKQDGNLHESRVYWARYENASGKTWETRNSTDRSAKLDIGRVYFLRLREWRENQRRKQAVKHGSRTLKAIQRESARMVAEREAAEEADMEFPRFGGHGLIR